MRRAAWLLLVAVTAAGVLVLFVFPGRTLLSQDRTIAATQHQIGALQHEDATLRARSAAMADPATIEREARQRFGLVPRGERAYAITAPPTTTASAGGTRRTGR